MGIVKDIGNITSDDGAFGGILFTLIFLTPGALTIYFFDKPLFLQLDPIKLLLLASGIMLPIYLLVSGFIMNQRGMVRALESVEPDKKKRRDMDPFFTLFFSVWALIISFIITYTTDLSFKSFYLISITLPIAIWIILFTLSKRKLI